MLSAKEKAKDLYDKMKGFRVKNSHRKKCALICVEEILEETKKRKPKIKPNTIEFYWEYSEYYLEVKKEIEKL